MAKKLTSAKAKEMLHNPPHGKPLTEKQRKFFGAVANAQNGIEAYMGGLTDKGFNYNGAWGGQFQMGGNVLPGAMGNMYARHGAPSEGKYAKKTLPSAAEGYEVLPEPTDPERKYKLSAVVASAKDILNPLLRSKNPKAYDEWEAGRMAALKKGIPAVEEYYQKNPLQQYLTPSEVKATLSKQRKGLYEDYIGALKDLREYEGISPFQRASLAGDIEKEQPIESLNYGFRFATQPVNISRVVKDRPEESFSYSYDPKTGEYKKLPAMKGGGKMMSYYQAGLDFQPKTISKNGGWLDKYEVPQAQFGDDLPKVGSRQRVATDNTKVVIPQRELRSMNEYLVNQALSNQAQLKPASKPINIEERNRRNKQYAQQFGRSYDENTGAVGPAVSSNVEKTMNRAMENIVEPMLEMEMITSGAPLVGKGLKSTGNYLKQAYKELRKPTSITSSVDDVGRSLDLEELRRVYHNSERFLQPEEARFLHKYGHGLKENYRTNISNYGWGTDQWNVNNQLPSPPSEIQFMPDGTTRTIYQQQPIIDYVDLRPINGFYPGTPEWNKLNDIIQNSRTYLTKPKVTTNKSGLTKEEVITKASSKDKDAISKMTEEEFQETVLKPTGEVVPYYQEDLISKFIGKNNVSPLSPQQYADEFNSKIDLLNDIIAKNNKSGVEYAVKELTPRGRLIFETPEQTIPNANISVAQHYLDALNKIDEPNFLYKGYEDKLYFSNMNSPGFNTKEEAKKWITDIIDEKRGTKIKSGESTWDVRLNPGQWRGDVEDIANTEYLRSIPGLEMSNTSSGVFADRVPRRGTGAYESINEYLKKLDLGRVKPGFNSQTDFSRGAWENFIKSGRGVGFYANPRTVYGSMKSVLPYIGIGGAGALGAGALEQKKKGGKIKKDDMGYWNPDNWGKPVEIGSNVITMNGVYEPLIGVSDTGDVQYMEPGEDYVFDGDSVTEYPISKNGGWLDKYK